MTGVIAGCMLGALLGMRHAVEPDHLAAVTTLAMRARSPWRSAVLGAWWGVGHTLALLGMGGVLMALRRQISPAQAETLEGLVGLMLMALGAAAVRRAWQEGSGGPVYVHGHEGRTHAHATQGPHLHVGRWTLARRPLLVGFIHGLAGSGALTAVALATLPTPAVQLVYMLLFGVGSATGMAVLSGVLGLPLARAAEHPRLHRRLSLSAGAISVALGSYWMVSACTYLLVA